MQTNANTHTLTHALSHSQCSAITTVNAFASKNGLMTVQFHHCHRDMSFYLTSTQLYAWFEWADESVYVEKIEISWTINTHVNYYFRFFSLHFHLRNLNWRHRVLQFIALDMCDILSINKIVSNGINVDKTRSFFSPVNLWMWFFSI